MSTPEFDGSPNQTPEIRPLEIKAEDGPAIPEPRRENPERHFGRRDPVVLIVIALLISIMLAYGVRRAHHSPVPTPAAKLQGQPAPDFSLSTPDGKTMKLSDFRGKAVLLNFWATWCEPCKVEMPWFIDLQKKYASQGLQVLGVAMDDASPADISSFAGKLGVNYPILIGKEEIGAQYGGIDYLPSTFYITKDGKILDHMFGLVSRSEIESNIQKALGQQVATK